MLFRLQGQWVPFGIYYACSACLLIFEFVDVLMCLYFLLLCECLYFPSPAISENRLSDRGAGDVYRVVTYVWILFGLSYLSLVISYITEVFIKKAEKMESYTKTKFEVGPRYYQTKIVSMV